MSLPSPHVWTFFRAGGLDQVRLETGADVAHLEELDQKLWVALACPVSGLELDEKTLAALDEDKDGRVRVPEILNGVRFCREALVDLEGLVEGSDLLPLSRMRQDTETGRQLLATARRILAQHGRPDADAIRLAEVEEAASLFAKTPFNGDGVITPAATDDPWLATLLAEIAATQGAEADRSGEPGVTRAMLDTFFADLEALDAWERKAEGSLEIRPLGDHTPVAVEAFQAAEARIDDYFARCRIAAFDPRAQGSLQRAETDYAALASCMLSADASELRDFPLALPAPERALPLAEGLNPAWRPAMDRFREEVVTLLLGERDALTPEDHASLRASLAPFIAWSREKPVTRLGGAGIARVREILASDARSRIEELLSRDKEVEADYLHITELEKLLRLHRDLVRLVNNFVSFSDFYAPGRYAAFQAGTLFIDGRACELCVRVENPGRHASLAGLAGCYLAYCDCARAGQRMQIAAVLSGGDRDYLMVGRNGIFYDRKGLDWDATIIKIVENPISLREAFFSPYKKFLRLVEEQITRRAGAADAAVSSRMSSAASATASLDKAAASPPKAPTFDLSSIALIGVAVSGITAVVGGLLQAFFGLGIWMPIGIAGIFLAISGPSLLIAALKLRQRNLGPVLDANGWAINGRVKVNIPFGGSLTRLQRFPDNAARSIIDPYQQKRSPWYAISYAVLATVLITLLSTLSYHQGWLPSAVEARLCVLGVPTYLVIAKDNAQKSVDEARAALASALEQNVAARKGHDDLEATVKADLRAALDKASAEHAEARSAWEKAQAEAAAAQALAARSRQPEVRQAAIDAPARVEAARVAMEAANLKRLQAEADLAQPASPRLQRAKERLDRLEAKVKRAESRLERYERRLERASEAIEVALNKEEARLDAQEADEEANTASDQGS